MCLIKNTEIIQVIEMTEKQLYFRKTKELKKMFVVGHIL